MSEAAITEEAPTASLNHARDACFSSSSTPKTLVRWFAWHADVAEDAE